MLYIIAAVVALWLVYDRLTLWAKTKGINGPSLSIPFVGETVNMVMNPWNYWRRQENFGSFSWNVLAGNVVYFAKDTSISRTIFQNAEGKMRLWLIFGAKAILGEHNLAFLHGPQHKALRIALLPLFTRKALSTYLKIQMDMVHKHLDRWCAATADGPTPVRNYARDLNIDTSIEVFVGPYIDDKTREVFTDLYWVINAGLLAFPVALPGTPLWKAVKAREKLVDILADAAVKSKAKMALGDEPACLLDYWMEKLIKAEEPEVSSDQEIGLHVLDFLFASQDASTSSIVWSVQVLAENPDVLQKIREEQARLRPNGEPITYETLQKMQYTNACVKEILRYRPPAPMVPHIAQEPITIKDGENTYNIPKGGVLLPSIWCSSFQGFTNPQKFDPDRFNDERHEHITYAKNYLVFGMGDHMCLGKDYAVNHLTAFTAHLAGDYEWQHFPTERSQDIAFMPTLVPEDGCIAQIKRRTVAAN
eukprot:TRINITY_DN3342_c0_g1_i1.p1 TRINITY_DN3342_c0_g1~~TRINITY_DN3342_c0_g1_i1.p1  ORF type:complete len:477 (-),score=197.52 TRINITY_DN3342_c0_g1_i1:158-1588(-)